MISAAIFLLLSMQTAAGADFPTYTVTGSPEEGLQFDVEPFPVAVWPRVDSALMDYARRRCAPKIAHFNGYSTTSESVTMDGKTVPGIRYKRTILCIDPVAPTAPAPANFKPSVGDAAAALEAFTAFFAAFDAEDLDLTERLSDGPPTPRGVMADNMRRMKAELGVGKRITYESEWLINPPGQHPGAFVDILYYQPLANGVTVCGRALFYRVDAKTYRMSRNLIRQAATPATGQANPC